MRRHLLLRAPTPLLARKDVVVARPGAPGGFMEWTCAKCGQMAKAADWTLLLSMGWRITPADEFYCVVCAKRLLSRASFQGPSTARDDGRTRRRVTAT